MARQWMATPRLDADAILDEMVRLDEEKGLRFELIDGRLVEMPANYMPHGLTESHVARLFGNHIAEHDLGITLSGEVLFELEPGVLARCPDVAFVRRERLLDDPWSMKAFAGSPDLAVEVISPGNRPGEMQIKTRHWLDHGATAVLLLYPVRRRATLARASVTLLLGPDDEIDLDPPLTGFRTRVRDLFPSVSRRS